MGHIIKQNFKENKTVSNTPTKIFNKNEKICKEINGLAGVPNPAHSTERSRSERSRSTPTLSEVEEFFKSANYPIPEAQKFFYYNQGRGWMLRDQVPIKDWQSLAHKWMLGIGKNTDEKKQTNEAAPDVQDLYKRFLLDEKMFSQLTTSHFHQLQLQLNETILQSARAERINQLSGTNQHSLNQLWDAYLNGKKDNELVAKDRFNLITLAKRIAVLKHFQHQKQTGANSCYTHSTLSGKDPPP